MWSLRTSDWIGVTSFAGNTKQLVRLSSLSSIYEGEDGNAVLVWPSEGTFHTSTNFKELAVAIGVVQTSPVKEDE